MNLKSFECYKKSKVKIRREIYYRIKLMNAKNCNLNGKSNQLTIEECLRLQKVSQRMTKNHDRRI